MLSMSGPRTRTAAAACLSLFAALLVPFSARTAAAAQGSGAPHSASDASSAAARADVLVDGWGDGAGYHVDVADAAGSFLWREVAVIRPGGVDAASWTGYQCTSGDGKFEAIAVLPTSAVNDEAMRDHGAMAYSLELATGTVRPLLGGVGLYYHSPGCGTQDDAVFTASPAASEPTTEVTLADLASGKVLRSASVHGQLTSAVPDSAGVVTAVRGSSLVQLAARGASSFAAPATVVSAPGVPYDVRSSSDGGVDLASVALGGTVATLWHEVGGALRELGKGKASAVAVFQGEDGHNIAAGVTPTSSGASSRLTFASTRGLRGPPVTASLAGDAVLGEGTVNRQGRATPLLVTGRHSATPQVLPPSSARVTIAVPGVAAPAGASPDAVKPQTAIPACAVPRLDPTRQVMQPDAAQVDWATQLDERGLLTAQRPANYDNLGLAAYAPSTDFPPITLSHPSGSSTTTVPRSVMEAILAQESNWDQASWHALPGIAGDPLVADYYGSGGTIDTIDYSGADCGYGVAQVTDGMFAGDTEYSVHGQIKIAADYAENIAAGLNILQSTWNQLYAAGITANGGDPKYLENWYFAIWAYNTGIQPTAAFGNPGCTPGPSCTGPDGTWGLGWSNNPANPDYPPNRLPFLSTSYGDAAHPADWPYQERVLGWMGSPLLWGGTPDYATPTYHGGGTWLKIPTYNSFCSPTANACDPGSAGQSGTCTLSNYECWWHAPASWVNCATLCATSSYTVASGTAEPSAADPHPPTCNANASDLPTTANGTPIIVDDETSPPLNIVGCGAQNWSDGGSFTYTYGTDSSGDPIGAIDTHQLGAGFGGRILFTHTEDGSEAALVNQGTWKPTLPKTQYYTIKVHVPATGAAITDAHYKVSTAGYGTFLAPLNQDQGREAWLTLGTVALAPGATVSLTNISGMTPGEYDVAFDALAFLPDGGTPGLPLGGAPSTAEEPAGENPSWQQCSCTTGSAADPVDTATGAYSESFTDLTTPGRGRSLAFTRTYDSALADPSGPNGSAAVDGAFGWGWTYSYGLRASTDPATGNVTVYQEDGSTVAFTNSSGSYTVTAPRYDATLVASGSTYVFTRRATQIYTFDKTTGHLLSESDPVGANASPAYATTLAYNAAGQLSAITDPAGRTYTLGWTSGHVTSLTDSAGRIVTYGYDAAGDLTDVYGAGTTRTPTTANNDHTTFGYAASHLMISYRQPDFYGDTTTSPTPVLGMTYDSTDRVTAQTNQVGATTTFAYGPSSSPNLVTGQTLVTDPAGHKELDTYTNSLLNSRVVGYATSSAGTWAYTYDPVSLGITSVTDPDGNIQTYSYDQRGDRISAGNALGATTSYTYNALGEVITSTDPDGVQTTYGYDEAGHIAVAGGGLNSGNLTYGLLTSTTAQLLPQSAEIGGTVAETPVVTENYYDTAAHPGDLTRSIDADGHTTTRTYDSVGDLSSVSDPAGDQTLYSHDTARGWLTSTVSPRGKAAGTAVSCVPPALGCTTYAHDAWGHVTTTTDPLGHSTGKAYDADGNEISSTDANGNQTTYGYNPANARTAVIRPDHSTLTTSYNGDGTVASTTDASGHATVYTYDPQGHRVSSTDPDQRSTTYTYDPAGNLLTTTDPLGRTTTDSYDAAAELTAITYSGSTTPAVSAISYDPDGRRTSMTDGTGTNSWQYDALGHVTAYTDGAGAGVAYTYDPIGNQLSITYPAAGTVSQTFDAAGRLSSITDWNGLSTAFGYDADGNVVSTAYPNGTEVSEAYDNADQLTSTNLAKGSSSLASLTYTRDSAGQVLTETPSGLPDTATSYQYNGLEQLAQVSGGSTGAFGYDAAGNATDLAGIAQGFDPADQLCWSTDTTPSGSPSCARLPSGATTYTDDAAGERTATAPAAGPSTSYTYNAAGELTAATTGSAAASYAYDGDGLRASKTLGGTTSEYVWDAAANGAGAPKLLSDGTDSYLYGPDGLPLEQISGSGAQWFFHDHLGSTRALTGASGAMVAAYAYSPYGATTGYTGTASTTLGYAGQYTDTESGLIYLRARYYDPVTAQFLTVDPARAATGQFYEYAGDDPVNAADPTGMFAWGKFFDRVSTVAAVAAVFVPGLDVVAGALAVTAGLATAGADAYEGKDAAAVFAFAGSVVGAYGFARDFAAPVLGRAAQWIDDNAATASLSELAAVPRLAQTAEMFERTGPNLDRGAAMLALLSFGESENADDSHDRADEICRR